MRDLFFKAKEKDGNWTYWINNDIDLSLIDEDTICQFTGICDRKGVPIFEYDIVKHVDPDYIGKYEQYELCMIMWVEPLCRFQSTDSNGYKDLSIYQTYEVIANING
jgi:uncharacterized phage protein (TIGR01671 family)